MPTKPKVCAFCRRGDRQITTEHAIAQWIQELFPSHSRAVLRHGDNFKRSWEIGKKNAYRINDVCSCCNTTLGKIETVAHDILEPLILNGMQTAIAAEQARILTAWFYKTVIACDLIKPIRTEPYFSPEDRKRSSLSRSASSFSFCCVMSTTMARKPTICPARILAVDRAAT